VETTGEGESFTYNIFVGDLRSEVTEEDLIEAFLPCGEIHSVHIFRDPHTKEQKGFGFVHFKTKEGQEKSLTEEFNHVPIQGRPCRVSRSEQKNTLFVGNLPVEMNQQEIFEAMTNILGHGLITHIELKTGPPPSYDSRGFCFLQFTSHQRADACRKLLQQNNIRGRPLNVSWAENRFAKIDDDTMSKVKTLFVSNISITVNEQVLIALLSEYGSVINCVIVKNPQSKQSRGFAFIEMDTRENAEKALKALDGSELVGQNISVVLAKPPPPKSGGRGRNVLRGSYHSPLSGDRLAYTPPITYQQTNQYLHPNHFNGPPIKKPYFAHPRPQRGFQERGRGGKTRGRGGGLVSPYQGPSQYQESVYQQPFRYQPYHQRQHHQQPIQYQQSYQMQAQMFPQIYGQTDPSQYYQYPIADQSQAAQYYQQYYPYKY